MKTIELTQGRVAIVDDDVFEWLSQWKWHAQRNYQTYYAAREGAGRKLRMHNEIMRFLGVEIPDGRTVDHRDGDGLNNQFENLRVATRQEQNRNRRRRVDNLSGFTGVTWDKSNKKWRAQVMVDGKNIFLGLFFDPISAAHVRDAFVREHFGAFAVLNSPPERRQAMRAAA